jgi:5'(3')-deoxyribonucleotidase
MKLFIDLDDVLVDCEQFMAKHFDLNIGDYDQTKWEGIREATGYSTDQFWEHFDYSFWFNLPLCSCALDLLWKLVYYRPCIITSPAPHSATAKQDWIQKVLPNYYNYGRYIITPSKETVAGPSKVLIDDSDDNVRKWEDNDGLGILFPQPWNERRDLVLNNPKFDRVEFVMKELRNIQKMLDKSEN